MAYCEKCGAYIPDGRVKCIACGFNPGERKTAGGSAAQESREAPRGNMTESVRARIEEERRRQQEESLRWAEQERARRIKEEQERSAGETRRGEQSAAANFGSGAKSRSQNRIFAVLSYFSILFILPFIFCPEDKFARFHAKQGLVLLVFSAIADVIAGIFPVGWVLSLLRIYFIIKGVSNAANGREEPLPYIGRYASK